MHNILLQTLDDAIFSTEGKLKDNNLAKQLYMLLRRDYSDSLRKLKDEDYISFIGKLRGLPNECPADLKRWQKNEIGSSFSDRRFVKLFIRGLRRYQTHNEKDVKYPSYYSIEFADKDRNPTSTVLLGSNGVGKTTIFNALEYVVLNHIPSVEIRDIYDFEDYLQHKNDETVTWEVGLDTKEIWKHEASDKGGNFQHGLEGKAIGVSAFFCHQGDVEVIERSESLSDYLYDQLGLGFYHQLVGLLPDLFDKEQNAWKELRMYKEKIRRWSAVFETIPRDRLVEAEEVDSLELFEVVMNAVVERQQALSELSKEYSLLDGTRVNNPFILITDYTEKSFRLWQDKMKELMEFLREDLGKLVETLTKEWLTPVVKGLTESYYHGIGEVDLKLNNLRLELNVLLNFNPEPCPIRSVLNTFRLKVFTISLKCALACCAMKLYNITLPMVIDDIFDSSDFSHRATIDKYIIAMLKKCDSINNAGHPLQLIFLTQDELIAEGIVRGINAGYGQNNVTLHRLVEPAYSVATNKECQWHLVPMHKKWVRHRPLSVKLR